MADTNSSTAQGSIDIAKKLQKQIEQNFTVTGTSGRLFKVGRPSVIPESVDSGHQVTRRIRAKMNLIDLVPCRSRINLDTIQNIKDMSGLLPQLDYGQAVEDYKKSCQAYNWH